MVDPDKYVTSSFYHSFPFMSPSHTLGGYILKEELDYPPAIFSVWGGDHQCTFGQIPVIQSMNGQGFVLLSQEIRELRLLRRARNQCLL